MMWTLAVINALGLTSGIVFNEMTMHIVFGVSFVAFFHRYAMITWEIIYKKESQLVNTDGRANMVIANEFVCFWVLVCMYILMVMKFGNLCVLASAIQCLIFQLIDFVKDESKKDIVVTLVFIAELIISVAYLI